MVLYVGITNTNYYQAIKDSREHFVINTVIISAWSKVFVATLLDLFLTIVNCKETVNCRHRELHLEWDRILGSIYVNYIFIYVLFYIFIIYFSFFLPCFSISHWRPKYELYSGGHFHSILTVSVSLTRQKSFLNSYHLGDM